MRANESSPLPPSLPPQHQLKPRPAVGLIIKAAASTRAQSAQTATALGGKKGRSGLRGDEVSINVSQRRLCLDFKLLLADALIILQP